MEIKTVQHFTIPLSENMLLVALIYFHKNLQKYWRTIETFKKKFTLIYFTTKPIHPRNHAKKWFEMKLSITKHSYYSITAKFHLENSKAWSKWWIISITRSHRFLSKWFFKLKYKSLKYYIYTVFTENTCIQLYFDN